MLDSLRKRLASVISPAPKAAGMRSVSLEELEAEVAADIEAGRLPPDAEERVSVSGQVYNRGLMEEEAADAATELKQRDTRMRAYDAMRRGDPFVTSQLMSIKLPILSGEFSVEPGETMPELPSQVAARKAAEAAAKGLEPGKPSEKPMPEPGAKLAEHEDEEPEQDEDEAADLASEDANAQAVMLVEANLFGKHAPEYQMRQTWRKFMQESLLKLDFGASFFERTYRWQDGPLGKRVVIDGLYWIKPESITEIHIDRTDALIGIRQEVQSTYWETDPDGTQREKTIDVRLDIPAEKLVWFLHDAEGGDHEGISIIRRFYMAAKRRGFLARLRVVDAQRRGAPMPTAEIPPDASPQNKAAVLQTLRRMAAGGRNETMFALNQGGVKIGYMEVGSSAPDISAHMESEELSIAGVFGTRFQMLGTSGEGSRAVGEVLADYFNLTLKSIASGHEEDIQRQLVEPLHLLNFGAPKQQSEDAGAELAELLRLAEMPDEPEPEDENPDAEGDGETTDEVSDKVETASVPVPRFRISGVTPPDLAAIREAKASGLMTWSDEDEQEYRRKVGWRELTPDELTKRAEKKAMGEALAASMAGLDPQKPGDAKKPEGTPKDEAPPVPAVVKPPAELAETASPVVLRALRRDPTPHEAAHVRLADIDKTFDDFQRDFALAVAPLRAAAIDEALAKMEVRGTRVTVPRLKSKALAETMQRLAERIREFGRETMRDEIRSQIAALQTDAALAEPWDPFADKPRRRGLKGVVTVAEAISEELETVISLNVDTILESVVRGVRRLMLENLAQDMAEAEAAEATRRTMLDASEAQIEAMARELASRGINGGRLEVVEEANESLEGTEYAVEVGTRSAILDNRTCEPCERLDGTQYVVGTAEHDANLPPAKCLGGANCRCFMTYSVVRRAA